MSAKAHPEFAPHNVGKRRKGEYLAERAYRDLRNRIMTGVFAPGDHLKEENLVTALGVSRSVVRQVLIQLTAEGLLKDEPKKGKSIVIFTEETLARLVPIRISLEQLAVREAITKLTEEDAKELKTIAARLREPDLDLSEQDGLDVALHRKIWQIADNDELEKILIRVVGPFHMMANAVMLSPYYRRNSAIISAQQFFFECERNSVGHQPLVDAICQRDAQAAVKEIEKHVTLNWGLSPEEFNRKVGKLLKKYWQSPHLKTTPTGAPGG